MAKKLKRCPFCKSKHVILQKQSMWMPKQEREYYCECLKCGAMSKMDIGCKDRVVKAWNRRDK